MNGLALEGGGARGSYHIGAMQAFTELSISFDVIAGTSIGAINAAMLAQGDFERLREIWLNIKTGDIFSPEDESFLELLHKSKPSAAMLRTIAERLRAVLGSGGVDTSRMRETFERYIDPQRLLDSKTDFGLVTVSLPDLKPVELFKHKIEKDMLVSYIMASATFPGFAQTEIGGKRFIDGGLYDNCPVNMLAYRGCDHVIAVRTMAIGVTRSLKQKSCEVITIVPSEGLGNLMEFSPETAEHNIKLGYFDTMRALTGLNGSSYYISDSADNKRAFERFCALPDEAVIKAARSLRISTDGYDPKRLMLEHLLPVLADVLGVKKKGSYGQILLAAVESRAKRCGIERLKMYTFDELLERAVEGHPRAAIKSTLLALSPDMAVDVIHKGM